jgi:lysophospholipase L1-like esterase
MRRVVAVLTLILVAQVAVAVGTPAAAVVTDPAPLVVSPGSPQLRYEGRWDIGDRRATTVNSGSRIFLRFHGNEVTARFAVQGIEYPSHIYAYVDGVKSEPIVVDRERIRLTPQNLARGKHELVLAVKDVSENGNRWDPPFASALQFEGFELPAGSAVRNPPAEPEVRLTFLGDSITQGVNILCPIPGSDCADATLDYAWLVAYAFGAGLEQVGFGAQGVTRGGNGNVPPAGEALDFNFAGSSASAWDPQVVVINQGTNDSFNDADAIEPAYTEYLRKVRHRYPAALILALEPVGFAGRGTAASEPIQQAVTAFGDDQVEYVSTRDWTGPLDFTEGLHPNTAGHQTIAERLKTIITGKLGPRTRPNPGACDKPSWVAAWALPVSGTSDGFSDQTLRVVLAPNFGGDQVRVRLSNAFGDRPVTFAKAAVGLVDTGAALRAGSSKPLTFGGVPSVTVPAGTSVLSDPVTLPVMAFKDVAVSVYAAHPTGPATGHTPLPGGATQARSYVTTGDQVESEDGAAFGSPSDGSRFVTAIDVFAPNDGVLAIFGDSITEGATWATEPYSTVLARRLHEAQADGGPRLSVVNVGISGNQLWADGSNDIGGPRAVHRLDRDVLAQSGLAGVVMMVGINDLNVFTSTVGGGAPTVEDYADAYTGIADRVSATRAELFLSPLTPAGDLTRPNLSSTTPEQIERRHAVNRWIRTSVLYDWRIDFEEAIKSPLEPNWIDTPYNAGDNLHPNTAGHQRMADSIGLPVFDEFHCGASVPRR